MHIEEFRHYCLSFKDAHEGMPFQAFFNNSRSILVFYVAGKMFCMIDIDNFKECTIKCDPQNIVDLKEQYSSVRAPFNLSPKHWISVSFNGDLPEEQLKILIRRSYELVIANLPKKIREQLKDKYPS